MAEALGVTVATWGPIAHRVLSGRSTRPGGVTAGPPLTGPERATAEALQGADELDATPAQVALAWTRARSQTVHPSIGPATVEQLHENLGVLDVTLTAEAFARLDAATGFTPGFPTDFIAEATPWAFGEVAGRVDGR
jgi:aryl-alcohol dehydrogenase-like predicted oxidoreductase